MFPSCCLQERRFSSGKLQLWEDVGDLGGKPQNISLYRSVIGKTNNLILMHKISTALSRK